ncbi:MAG: hypothetical protein ACI8RZ_007053 [Myxococcota bacterium]|jgi:hypothetical protein
MLRCMKLSCPKCSAPARPRPVLKLRCRKCGHRWSRVLAGGIAFELQRTEGDEVIGPIDRSRIREMLYAGELTGRERVRLPGSDGGWRPVAACEELSEVLELLEIQAPRDHRIQGWQSQSQPQSPKPQPLRSESQPVTTPAPTTPAPSGRPIGLILGGVVLIVIALAAFMLWS